MAYFYSQAHKSIRLVLVVTMLWLPVFAQANCLLMMNMSEDVTAEQSLSEPLRKANKPLAQQIHSSHQSMDMVGLGDASDNAAKAHESPHHGQSQGCDGECLNCASCSPALSAGDTYRSAISTAVETRFFLDEPFTGNQSPPFRPPIC